MSLWLKQVANGNDDSEVKDWDAAVKSISRSRTFGEDTNDPIKIAGYMDLLAESIHRALKKDRFLFKIVTLVVRYDDFSTYTRSKTVSVRTSDMFVIKKTARQPLSEFLEKQKIRLVDVGISRLREIYAKLILITDFCITVFKTAILFTGLI